MHEVRSRTASLRFSGPVGITDLAPLCLQEYLSKPDCTLKGLKDRVREMQQQAHRVRAPSTSRPIPHPPAAPRPRPAPSPTGLPKRDRHSSPAHHPAPGTHQPAAAGGLHIDRWRRSKRPRRRPRRRRPRGGAVQPSIVWASAACSQRLAGQRAEGAPAPPTDQMQQAAPRLLLLLSPRSPRVALASRRPLPASSAPPPHPCRPWAGARPAPRRRPPPPPPPRSSRPSPPQTLPAAAAAAPRVPAPRAQIGRAHV